MWFNSKNNNMKKVKLVQIEVKDLIQLKPAEHIGHLFYACLKKMIA